MPHLYTCEGAIVGPPSCEGPGSSNNFHRHFRSKVIVGYQKITEDKASDASLLDAEIAFQPQTRTSRSNVRRGGRQTQTSRPLSDAEVARRRPRIPMSDADPRPLSDADLSQLRVLTQTQVWATPRSNTDASLWAPRLNIRVRSASSARPAFLL